MAAMETIGIIALVVAVALTVGYALKGRLKASPADPNRDATEAQLGGRTGRSDRPADAGAEGMAVPEPGEITTGPEDRERG